tara:strand:+ start:2222 stop:2620 length:399 start_codon:yes stop_codon:yes gene_type:complete
MAKETAPVVLEAVNSTLNMSIIYISIIVCIIVVGTYFMYRVYKKLQSLSEDVLEVNKKGNTLDVVLDETKKYMETVDKTMKLMNDRPAPVEHAMYPPEPIGNHHEEQMFKEPHSPPVLEDITEELPNLEEQD